MEYFSVIERIRQGLPIERVYIEGSQTEGHIRIPEPKPKLKGKNIMSGYKYADESKAREKLEELKLDESYKQEKGMYEADDLTSIGTLPNVHDLNPDSLTQVYSLYSFKTKPEPKLLVHQYKDEIIEQITTNQVTIIKGVTGCGKSTQVPQFILDQHEEINMHCNIVVTQPRRIAATSVAKRICDERQWQLGSIVGYQIALDRNASPDTRLLFVTTGVLLQMLVKRQSLNDFTHIIVDEVHERDSETDFLLIVLKKFLRSPQCRTKLILMSATMNVNQFVDYYSRTIRGVTIEPPVIELSLPTNYPVQFFYLDSLVNRLPLKIPDIQIGTPSIDPSMYDLARALVEVFHIIDKNEHKEDGFIGSVLIFLPGIAEIENMYDKLRKPPQNGEKWWLCPLHSSVTYDEQIKVFRPPPKNHRKIIIATNIAESSITVSDTKYVIDFCLSKQQVLAPETGYTGLELTWISKAQGTQRAGRVGRVMPGRVYRLITKAHYVDLPEMLSPEIMRCPLDQLVLKAKQLNMGPPEQLLGLALDPPDLSNIHKTVLNLKQQGALLLTVNGEYKENDGDLTFVGFIMASLPLDTQLTKLIILGHMFSLLTESITMACALSLKSIFSTPFQMQMKAYTTKLRWADFSCSDAIAFLNAYNLWKNKVQLGIFKRSGGHTEEDWCRQNFIQKNIIREVSRLELEITSRLRNIGIEEMKGNLKVRWGDIEKPLILKVIIAGAFYPNYFIPLGQDEKEAVKLLGGRDPFTTVYLSGMPHNQPGPLYSHSIKKHFTECGSAIDVSFDGSRKVYLQFGSSILEKNDDTLRNQMPGKISSAVYRAIKLRQLQIPITIPLLMPHEARKRAQEIFGDRLKPSVFWNMKKESTQRPSQLPAIGTNILSVIISHVDSPSNFWVNINDDMNQNRILWIHRALNTEELPQYKGPFKDGSLCIAPFFDADAQRSEFYRAKIIRGADRADNPVVPVFFIDYGNQEIVNIHELKDFPQHLINIKEEPPLAIQASLAEIGPYLNNNPKGDWGSNAANEFRKYFPDNSAIAKVYSAVNNVMALVLFSNQELSKAEVLQEFPLELSFNYHLINCGLAEPIDEPYLSRENHMIRETAEQSPESLNSLSTPLSSYFQPLSEINFTSPLDEECRSRVTLRGPKSPLEMSLYSLPKKCQGKEIVIEWNSVNSVLLDTYPMDPHIRLVVATSVTSSNNNRLTLRNTTIMPNIHGLAALICLIFAPRVELRADKERQFLSGALCGLGFDPETGVPFYPENDMEISFDTKFTLLDLQIINKLRFWMDLILGGGEGPDADVTKPIIVKSQNKIKEYILDLLNKRRPNVVPIQELNAFEWDQIPSEDLLDPHSSNSASLYPLIWGINLVGDGKQSSAILAHLATLENMAKGKEIMRSGTQCDLCQVFLQTLPDLRLHLATTLHKMKVSDFKSCIAS